MKSHEKTLRFSIDMLSSKVYFRLTSSCFSCRCQSVWEMIKTCEEQIESLGTGRQNRSDEQSRFDTERERKTHETKRAFIKQGQGGRHCHSKEKWCEVWKGKVGCSEKLKKYCNQWKDKKIFVRGGSKAVGMSPSTFYRRCRKKE